jgi:nitrogen fixation NifU-like protein
MANDNLYTEALMEHVQHPDYKYKLAGATHSHEGVNPSCGDDLILQIRMGADGRIEEAAYTGHGCAVSQASADMMSDLMVGKTPEEALELCRLFGDMVRGDETDSAKLEEQLDEAACLQSISHMPARVKCAELAWRTLEEMLKE